MRLDTLDPQGYSRSMWKRVFWFLFDNRGEVVVPPVEPPVEPPITPPVEPPVVDGKWFDGFSDEVRNHPTTQRYKNNEEAMRGHIELEKKISSKGVLIPGENAGEQEKNDFAKAMGRPDKAEDYELHVPEGEVDPRLKGTPESEKAFRDFAFKSGLPASKVKELHQWYHEQQAANLKAQDDKIVEEKNDCETKLRNEWGAKYDENVSKASGLIKKAGGDDALNWFEKGEGNNPTIIKMLANVASMVSEDVLGPKGEGINFTPEEAKIEIAKLQGDPAFMNESDPMHDKVVEKITGSYKQAYPNKVQ